ncbi:hypothetical protein GA0061101_15217 [Rhizobium lusitanum]|uniref:Uncharacterized protein n=3 Tax=Rhizobium TaxID=379 RepID=A0A1C3XKB9_9HYPH|nr:hypothetical protein GA0061101_15217 [Rhizobium lusitanum]
MAPERLFHRRTCATLIRRMRKSGKHMFIETSGVHWRLLVEPSNYENAATPAIERSDARQVTVLLDLMRICARLGMMPFSSFHRIDLVTGHRFYHLLAKELQKPCQLRKEREMTAIPTVQAWMRQLANTSVSRTEQIRHRPPKQKHREDLLKFQASACRFITDPVIAPIGQKAAIPSGS